MPLSAAQQQIANSAARFRVAVCGRRFGKTYLALREMCKWSSQPNRKVWYISPTYRQSKQTIWKPLKDRLQNLRWVKKINESDLTIELVNGSTISLRGADNFDSLRGVGLDGIVMDEFSFINETAWTEVLRPTLSDTQGHALFISTPAGRGNWAFDLFQRGQQSQDAVWQSWQFTTMDGGRVPETEIESARNDLDERTFRQEYLASFETYAGVIYYSFSPAHNVTRLEIPEQDRDRVPLYIGVDFNVNPISAIIAIRTGEGLHCIDEVSIMSSNTDELCQEIRTRYPRNRIVCFPDPAGAARKTSAGGRTDISILQSAGFEVKFRHSHPAVRDRINAVNSLLCSTHGQRRLTMDPACRNMIDCLSKHVYKEGTSQPEKNGDKDYSHMNDALGYMVEFLHPVRAPVPEVESAGHWRVKVA
jgi:hypothetical protein